MKKEGQMDVEEEEEDEDKDNGGFEDVFVPSNSFLFTVRHFIVGGNLSDEISLNASPNNTIGLMC